MTLSKRLRYEILRRDNHACRYCGRSAPEVPLTVDHVIPIALGGGDDPTNLATACKDCNSGKSASAPDAPLVADVTADALRWSAAIRYAADEQLEDLAERQARAQQFSDYWTEWRCPDGTEVPRPGNWPDSLDHLFRSGLHQAVVLEAVRTAMANTRLSIDRIWPYFCGICWRRVDELREAAAARIAADEGQAN